MPKQPPFTGAIVSFRGSSPALADPASAMQKPGRKENETAMSVQACIDVFKRMITFCRI
jgi:hypothetical protein